MVLGVALTVYLPDLDATWDTLDTSSPTDDLLIPVAIVLTLVIPFSEHL